jgi:hypothetical protein
LIGGIRIVGNATLGPVGVTPNDVAKGINPLDLKMDGKYTNYKQPKQFIPPTKKDKDGNTVPDDTKSSNPANQLIDRIEYIRDNYPTDFISPEQFGYNGDYALFGSSDENNKQKYVMKIPNKSDPDYELQEVTSATDPTSKVIASDHLPVYSMVDTGTKLGGRRTRRHKMRSRKSRGHKFSVHKLRSRKTRSKKRNQQKARKSRKMRRH